MDKKSKLESIEMAVFENDSFVEDGDESIDFGACGNSFPRILVDQDDKNQDQVSSFYQQNMYNVKFFLPLFEAPGNDK